MKAKTTILIGGGIGKNLAAAAAVEMLSRRTGEGYNILTGWPDVWLHHPSVKGLASLGDPVESHKLVAGRIILRPEPYDELSYREGKEHLIGAFCRQLGFTSSIDKPLLTLTEPESDWAISWAEKLSKESGGKKLVAYQPFGGSATDRDFLGRAFSQDISLEVSLLLQKQNLHPVLFRDPRQYKVPGCSVPDLDLRYSLAMLSAFEHIVCIDSWMVHAAAALNKEALVFYGSTDPDRLGYKTNVNVSRPCKLGRCNRPEYSLPDPFACPFDKMCIDWTAGELEQAIREYLNGISV